MALSRNVFDVKQYSDLKIRVRGHSRSSKMTPFDSLHMLSYYRPIVTLCLECTVFEIWRNYGRKSPKNLHHPHLTPPPQPTPGNIRINLYC